MSRKPALPKLPKPSPAALRWQKEALSLIDQAVAEGWTLAQFRARLDEVEPPPRPTP